MAGYFTWNSNGITKLPTIQDCMNFMTAGGKTYMADAITRFMSTASSRNPAESPSKVKILPIKSNPGDEDSDGDDIDIDVEVGMEVEGSPCNPTWTVKGLIDGIDKILRCFPRNFMLTMAPETANLVDGIGRYGDVWGNYLPLIMHFYDRITRVHMQYYNSGEMYDVCKNLHRAGTVDFIVYLTEAIIKGFPIADMKVHFCGLPPNKVAVGLPASKCAAYNDNGFDESASL